MMKIFKKTINIIGATFIVWATIILIGGIIAIPAFVFTKSQTSPVFQFFDRFSLFLAGIAIIIFMKRKYKYIYPFFIETILPRKNKIKWFYIAIVISLFSFSIITLISAISGAFYFESMGTKLYSVNSIINQIIWVWLFGNLFAVIGEEILFRGFLLNYVYSKTDNSMLSIIITSFIFAVGHLMYIDFLNYVIAFVGSIAMCYGYLKYKSIYLAIGIHYSYNIFNDLLASSPGRGPLIPYLFKLKFPVIENGLGGWIDLLIITSFALIIFILYKINPNNMDHSIYNNTYGISSIK